MEEEFYHKDLFGAVVDVDFTAAEEEELVGSKKRPDFNIFIFTDAVGTRDKRKAWMLYQQALEAGFVPEEMFYKLVWQVKTLLLAANTRTSVEADMKAFPYNKAKGNLKKWKLEELEKLSEDLVLGYHKARRGEGEIETLVEKIILSI